MIILAAPSFTHVYHTPLSPHPHPTTTTTNTPQTLVHLAITHKNSLTAPTSSPSSFNATAALTRLLEYAEQGLAGLEKAGAALRAAASGSGGAVGGQQGQGQQQAQAVAAAGRAFEQVR